MQVATQAMSGNEPRTLEEALEVIAVLHQRIATLTQEYEAMCHQATATAAMLGSINLGRSICRQCAAQLNLKPKMFTSFELKERCDHCQRVLPTAHIDSYEQVR